MCIRDRLTPKTKAIVCVHLAGWPCDMDPIMALAEERGIYIVEDCAQAHGAKYKGRSVGSIGHFGAWSFCQDKIMTTGGEGGMVTTNDESLWRKAWAYKDHGKSYAAVYEKEHPPGYRWLHESFVRIGALPRCNRQLVASKLNVCHRGLRCETSTLSVFSMPVSLSTLLMFPLYQKISSMRSTNVMSK